MHRQPGVWAGPWKYGEYGEYGDVLMRTPPRADYDTTAEAKEAITPKSLAAAARQGTAHERHGI
jgi:hypothetical protein